MLSGTRGERIRGDDEINVYDTSGGDTVQCGPGEDTVLYDVVLIGIAVDSIDSDCEGLVAF